MRCRLLRSSSSFAALSFALLGVACDPIGSDGGPGATDGGPVHADGGVIDGGAPDAGLRDGGAGDAGARDAGLLDAGLLDAGLLDAGLVDAGLLDAGLLDAGLLDAGLLDAGLVDAGLVDAGLVDAGLVDAGAHDSGILDAGGGDDGGGDAGHVDGGGLDLTSPAPIDPYTLLPELPYAPSGAPALDPSVFIPVAASVQFLVDSGDQVGLDPEVLDPLRLGVIRGQAFDQNLAPLPGVRASVQGYPELGEVQTRADGRFDLVVNSGGPLTVRLQFPGRLDVYRRVDVGWAGTRSPRQR